MNPDQIASRICRLLDASADDLPPHIQARLSEARGVALSRLAAQQTRATHPGGQRHRAARGWSWAGLSPWARLGAATTPVLLAILLVLPNLEQDTDETGRHRNDTTLTAVQGSAPATEPPHPGNHPAPIAVPPPGEASVLVTADPAPPSDDPFEDDGPITAYRHAFTPAPGMSIPVAAGTGSRFHQGYGGGFTRVGTGTPISFTMPITPNPAPPLSSFDPTPSWGAGR
ncbi:MAG: DUF3619 family protein [Lautropia sp.]|nr:DUF3619 family protein [Lautropia sp.]